jgi:hypothetical protein
MKPGENSQAPSAQGRRLILPYSEEHYELFQWIISEVVSMGGDGSFIRTSRVETMENEEIRQLFNQQREKEYRVDRKLTCERRFRASEGTRTQEASQLSDQLTKLKGIREYPCNRFLQLRSRRQAHPYARCRDKRNSDGPEGKRTRGIDSVETNRRLSGENLGNQEKTVRGQNGIGMADQTVYRHKCAF